MVTPPTPLENYMDLCYPCSQFSSKTYIIFNRYHAVRLQFTKQGFCNVFRLYGVDFLVGPNFLDNVCCILLSLSVVDFLVGSNFLQHMHCRKLHLCAAAWGSAKANSSSAAWLSIRTIFHTFPLENIFVPKRHCETLRVFQHLSDPKAP